VVVVVVVVVVAAVVGTFVIRPGGSVRIML